MSSERGQGQRKPLAYALVVALLVAVGLACGPQGATAGESVSPAEEQVVLDESALEQAAPEEDVSEGLAANDSAAVPEHEPGAAATEEASPEGPDVPADEPAEAVLESMGGSSLGGSSPESAPGIALGGTYHYNLSQQEDGYEWYEFTLNEPGTISIAACPDFSKQDTVSFSVSAKADPYDWIISRSYWAGEFAWHHTADVGLAAGTYYLMIEEPFGVADSTGDFKIDFTPRTAWETEKNDGPATADPIELGTVYSGTSAMDSDTSSYPEGSDWYVFTLAKKTTVAITYGVDGADSVDSTTSWGIGLYARSQVNYDDPHAFSGCTWYGNLAAAGTTESSSGSLTLAAGTYFVMVGDEVSQSGYGEDAYHFCAREVTDISGATVAAVPNQPYTGKAVKPSPKVTYNGVTLEAGTDYTLSYKNNVKAGTATITITGKGAYAGTKSVTFKIVAPSVTYRVHVQTYGWQGWKKDGQMAGTTGKSKRLEGINIKLQSAPYSGGIQYRTHVQRIGWQGWRSNGAMAGTSGRALRLEAIQIRLTGQMAEHYDVYYRVHAQHFGWMGWAKNGQSAGTAGYAYRLEGIEIRIVPKGAPAPGSTANAFRQKK